MKLSTDEEMKSIGKSGRQSLLYMREIAEAQAKLTAKEIFENIESNWGWLSGKKHNSLDAIMAIKYETWLELKQKFGVD